MFNYGATSAQELRLETLKKQGKVLGSQLFMGTIALPFVNSCVTIAQLLRLFPWSLLLWPQYPSYKNWERKSFADFAPILPKASFKAKTRKWPCKAKFYLKN